LAVNVKKQKSSTNVVYCSAQNVAMLYIGRLVAGMCVGVIFVAAPGYITEVADPTMRGTLGSCFQLLVTVGIFLMDFIGIWTNWRVIGIVAAAIAALATLAMVFLAYETPNDCLSVHGR
jgi:MFS family permease